MRVESQPCRKFPPQPGYPSKFLGYLTYEVSQQEFYIQLTEDTDLIGQIVAAVQTESATSMQIVQPVIGQACIARYRDDMAWYRAQIMNCSPDGIEVFFVDFGNTSREHPTEILEISEGLSNTHPLAVRCSLVTQDATQSLTAWAQGILFAVQLSTIYDLQSMLSLLFNL